MPALAWDGGKENTATGQSLSSRPSAMAYYREVTVHCRNRSGCCMWLTTAFGAQLSPSACGLQLLSTKHHHQQQTRTLHMHALLSVSCGDLPRTPHQPVGTQVSAVSTQVCSALSVRAQVTHQNLLRRPTSCCGTGLLQSTCRQHHSHSQSQEPLKRLS